MDELFGIELKSIWGIKWTSITEMLKRQEIIF